MKKAEQILSEHTGETGIYLIKGQIRGSDAIDAMEEYKNQSCYIPIAIETPKKSGYYLCLTHSGYLPFIAMFHFDSKKWTHEGEYINPNFWQDLPAVLGI